MSNLLVKKSSSSTQPNNRLKPVLAALAGEKPTRYPVWFLRQAGRYLPEYRQIREKVSFLDLCRNPALAAEVTLQPLRRFDLDASIVFSDILIPLTGMGLDLTFDKGHGPLLNPPVRNRRDVQRLKFCQVETDLGYVAEAVLRVKEKLEPHQTMIGFAGAPMTVASYAIEGQGSKTYFHLKNFAFSDPAGFMELLEKIALVTTDYVAMQVNAGAEMIMIFDTWAAQLSPEDYRNLVLPSTQKLLQAIRSMGVPVVYYPGQGGGLLSQSKNLSPSALSVDWRISLSDAQVLLDSVGARLPLQGNLDPSCLFGGEAFVRAKVRSLLEEAQNLCLPGHIFNVGHGLLPETPIDALGWVMDELRAFDGGSSLGG